MLRLRHHRFPFSPITVILVALGAGLLFGAQGVIPFLMMGRRFDAYAVLGPTVTAFLLWAPIAPLAYNAAHLALDQSQTRGARILLLGMFSVVIAAVHGTASFWLFAARYLLFDQVNLSAAAIVPFQVRLVQSWLELWVLTGLFAALVLWRRGKQQELDLLQRERNLAEARLKALRLQLPPHFMLNALNAAAGEMDDDPERAADMLAQLGSFLRTILRADRGPTHALEREIDHLRTYLEIVRMRRGVAFEVRWHIDDDLADMPTPTLILQPLVENAVKYGLDADPHRALIEIEAKRDGERVRLAVRDGGASEETPRPATSTGIGLQHTRERLAALYGEDFAMEAGPRPEGGFAVCLSIPIAAKESFS
ncbi:sensor histidine kinase [Acanthopleuribacter pedis]|uniref:Histidine kinase n=1 Tax=Acanthopleuribacter pedis TaxID=442870 RepID=A0A8J7QB91_9BACT|nr:histidine kinase [Acanthopleuribacter pedis]MBO1317711.1 histidine kinase [Acanthopleuribacter pedis]